MRMAHARKSANLSLDAELVREGRELGLNLSRAAEEGIARAVKAEKERRWREENAEALEASNRWVKEHGLPLAQYRMFKIGAE